MSPFRLVVFAVLAQSVAAMTTLTAVFLPDTVVRSPVSPALRPFSFNINLRETRLRDSILCSSRIKKMLGRTETRNRDRVYCQTIRTIRCISRDGRARIAICSLRTPTEIRRNYSIDDLWSRVDSRAFAHKRRHLHCDARVTTQNKGAWPLKTNFSCQTFL